CDGAGRVLDLRHGATGIIPVVDERAIRAYPLFLPAVRIGAALRVAEIIFHQRLRRARRTPICPSGMRSGGGTTINRLALYVRPTQVLPPVQFFLPRPGVSVAVR